MQIWRCYAVWDSSLRIIFVPLVLVLVETGKYPYPLLYNIEINCFIQTNRVLRYFHNNDPHSEFRASRQRSPNHQLADNRSVVLDSRYDPALDPYHHLPHPLRHEQKHRASRQQPLYAYPRSAHPVLCPVCLWVASARNSVSSSTHDKE